MRKALLFMLQLHQLFTMNERFVRYRSMISIKLFIYVRKLCKIVCQFQSHPDCNQFLWPSHAPAFKWRINFFLSFILHWGISIHQFEWRSKHFTNFKSVLLVLLVRARKKWTDFFCSISNRFFLLSKKPSIVNFWHGVDKN